MVLWTLSLATVIFLVAVKVYQKLTCGICKSSAHMVGKVVIVTGGNSGLGLETAKDLASRGARVILACRSVAKATAAVEKIVKDTGNTDVHFRQLDLTSLRSVREFCANIIKTEKRLDVLINNAGAGGLGNHVTSDGIHVGMQVNYFAPFLLTCLLVPLMKSSAPSRIINVSSMIHKYSVLDFENLNMEKYWSDYLVYANSKLFLILMTVELSDRLKGTGVTVNALHPGVSATNIFRNIPSEIIRNIVEKGIHFMFKSPWEASQTAIYLAVAPELRDVTGKYFIDCRECKPSKVSLDREHSERLWTESERLVKFSLKDS
ncbi:unnamed protein product [Diatraea saccharalis]|uniref:Uncharacterized protein n=1 Tax=Diatraea saccharalis TaxID=40085 RepID=A0A9N9REJ4_9NEOP|nr:unnamed protein product [Diatraea saccharalis]